VERSAAVAPVCGRHCGAQSERARITELGGVVSEIGGVFRVNGSLAVTRAFGDAKYVSGHIYSRDQYWRY